MRRRVHAAQHVVDAPARRRPRLEPVPEPEHDLRRARVADHVGEPAPQGRALDGLREVGREQAGRRGAQEHPLQRLARAEPLGLAVARRREDEQRPRAERAPTIAIRLGASGILEPDEERVDERRGVAHAERVPGDPVAPPAPVRARPAGDLAAEARGRPRGAVPLRDEVGDDAPLVVLDGPERHAFAPRLAEQRRHEPLRGLATVERQPVRLAARDRPEQLLGFRRGGAPLLQPHAREQPVAPVAREDLGGGRMAEVGRGEPQVHERGAAAHDELAPVGVRRRQRARRVAVDAQLVPLDLEDPGLRVVARRREDRPLQEEPDSLRRTGRRGKHALGFDVPAALGRHLDAPHHG